MNETIELITKITQSGSGNITEVKQGLRFYLGRIKEILDSRTGDLVSPMITVAALSLGAGEAVHKKRE